MAKMHPIEKFFVNIAFQHYLHQWFVLGPLLKRLPTVTYNQILQIGAGVGITTEFLRNKYPTARITATDFDEESVATAQQKRKLPNVKFAQADATHLHYPDNYFDAAFSILTLHHIQNFPKAIRELARVVRHGGDIYILDIPSASFNLFHFRKSKVPGHFKKNDLMSIGKKNGLKIVDLGGNLSIQSSGY